MFTIELHHWNNLYGKKLLTNIFLSVEPRIVEDPRFMLIQLPAIHAHSTCSNVFATFPCSFCRSSFCFCILKTSHEPYKATRSLTLSKRHADSVRQHILCTHYTHSTSIPNKAALFCANYHPGFLIVFKFVFKK